MLTISAHETVSGGPLDDGIYDICVSIDSFCSAAWSTFLGQNGNALQIEKQLVNPHQCGHAYMDASVWPGIGYPHTRSGPPFDRNRGIQADRQATD